MNARYICYGLRAGQVRVLHKDTASRALLRGHTAQIADMKFAPSAKDDILASFGVDGCLFVKRVVAGDGGDAVDEKALLQITVSPPPADVSSLVPRVAWLSKSELVGAIGDAIFVATVDVSKNAAARALTVDVSLLGEPCDGVHVIAAATGKPSVTDLSVSLSGDGRLAVGYADGTVRVWSPRSGETDEYKPSPFFVDQARSSITLVLVRPRRRGGRRSLRTFPGASLRPPLAFNPRPRCLSTPLLTPFNSTPTFRRFLRATTPSRR